MKASPLLISWHNENTPIYSTHFAPHGKGRLATAGGDNNVRLWKVDKDGSDRRITYLTTLIKHTQAVNVVRFAPRGDMLASAGDDGNTLLWVPSETHNSVPAFGEDPAEDRETWRIKLMCRSLGSEIYDLAWSPDAVFFITGSMDNIARIYNAQTGQVVRQIAEHNHFVQGVAWDPLNEYVATQSSDRSVHIYSLKTKDGQFSLNPHNKVMKMDLPGRRHLSDSPAPQEGTPRILGGPDASSINPASPVPSMPGTPNSLRLPMEPPAISQSRRSSFGSSASMRRSASPAPSMPLPAVRPMENSPNPFLPREAATTTIKNHSLYANETHTSFFRRLTFAPDGSLLFTPAGQYRTAHPTEAITKPADDLINTVYIYTRAGLNKPPIAHLPGHKKPSIAVRCSPIYYTHRQTTKATTSIAIDTSSAEEAIPALPEPAVPTKAAAAPSPMDPPPSTHGSMPSPREPTRPASSPKTEDQSSGGAGPLPAFALPHRMVYAVATQDSVLVYDTQQSTPLVVVSNLHYATFTDLTWSTDGLTLLMSSSDGFCSNLTFSSGELGDLYTGHVPTLHHPSPAISTVSSAHVTPIPTPTTASAPMNLEKQQQQQPAGIPGFVHSVSPALHAQNHPIQFQQQQQQNHQNQHTQRPASPARSNSTSSIATQSTTNILTSNPTPTLSNVPSLGVSNSNNNTGPTTSSSFSTSLPWTTPPQTPMSSSGVGNTSRPSSVTGSVLGKRAGDASESDREDGVGKGEGEAAPGKKRRVAPTLVGGLPGQ